MSMTGHVEVNKFISKNNNDMMQCITYVMK